MTQLSKLQDKFILVSAEEIKEGDYIFETDQNNINVAGANYVYNPLDKKIISQNPDFSLLKEEDCKKIGFVNVEKLAVEETIRNEYNSEISFKQGFRRAQSLNDKKFSEQQVIEIVEKSRATGLTAEYLILSLQQTSWDVEVNELNQITKIL